MIIFFRKGFCQLKRYLLLELAFFKNCLTRDVQFRSNFLLVFVMDIVWYLVNLAFFEVIYLNTNTISGYSRDEVFFFLATTFVIDALDMSLFASGLWVLGDLIRKGDLDTALTKPVSPMFFTSMRYVSVGSLLDLLFASCLLAFAWHNLNPSPTVIDVIAYMVLMIAGLIVMYSIQLGFAATGFIFVNASSGLQMGFHHLYQLALKPESIYKGVLRFALIYLLPMIVISAIPARMILKGFEPVYFLTAILIALTSFTLSRKYFYFALRHYESASS
ncbi:MAG: hypothetical protein HGB11_15025 [Chlorobiales bacterium]|nr:hypothetical protein [Chlorobiales bacterium]